MWNIIATRKPEDAAKLYGDNVVTLATAAEAAGASVREMVEYLRQRKVVALHGQDDVEHDLKGIYARLIEGSP